MAVNMVSRPPRRLTPARLVGQTTIRQRPRALPVRIRPTLPVAVALAGEKLGFRHRALITLLLAGAMVAIIGPGSLASFNATTAGGESVSTATLVLDSGSNGASASECISAGVGTGNVSVPAANSGSCTSFNVTGGALILPDGSIGAVQTHVKNLGDFAASTLTLGAAGACTLSASSGQPYNGGGNICNQIEVNVQEYRDGNFSSAYQCIYGPGSGGTSCTGFDSSHTLADLGTNHLTGSAGAISVPVYNGDGTTLLKSGGNAFFQINLSFPSSAFPAGTANTFQGETGDLVFVWAAAQ